MRQEHTVVYVTPQCTLVHISCKEERERDSVSSVLKPLLYLGSHKILQTYLICYLQCIWKNILGFQRLAWQQGKKWLRLDVREKGKIKGWKVQ